MREVEAQLVGLDRRAGLVDVVAEPSAQGGVQQVRGGVVGLDRVARAAVDDRADVLARLQRALLVLDDDDLVGAAATRSTSTTRALQSPSSQVSQPWSETCPPPAA